MKYDLYITDEFILEDIGVQEEWVYDIEVEECHNFFGNNILVHNSYHSISPIVDKFIDANPDSTIDDRIDEANRFGDTELQPVINKTMEDLGIFLNAYEPEAQKMDREIISDCMTEDTTIDIRIDDEIINLTFGELTDNYDDWKHHNLEVLSYNGKEKEFKKILNLQLKPLGKQIVEISNGYKTIQCTEDHKIAILSEGVIIYKKAIDVLQTDNLILN